MNLKIAATEHKITNCSQRKVLVEKSANN